MSYSQDEHQRDDPRIPKAAVYSGITGFVKGKGGIVIDINLGNGSALVTGRENAKKNRVSVITFRLFKRNTYMVRVD